MENNDEILEDLTRLDQIVKDADDNLVEVLKQNEDRLYDVVKTTLPIPVLNFSFLFNENIASIIFNNFVMRFMYLSIIYIYCFAIILYGISYFLGIWDSKMKRNMLSDYKRAPALEDIPNLLLFLESYNLSGKYLRYANRCKNISIICVTTGFILFIFFICFLVNLRGIDMSKNQQRQNSIIGTSFVADSVPIKGVKGNEFERLSQQLKPQPVDNKNIKVNQPVASLNNKTKK